MHIHQFQASYCTRKLFLTDAPKERVSEILEKTRKAAERNDLPALDTALLGLSTKQRPFSLVLKAGELRLHCAKVALEKKAYEETRQLLNLILSAIKTRMVTRRCRIRALNLFNQALRLQEQLPMGEISQT